MAGRTATLCWRTALSATINPNRRQRSVAVEQSACQKLSYRYAFFVWNSTIDAHNIRSKTVPLPTLSHFVKRMLTHQVTYQVQLHPSLVVLKSTPNVEWCWSVVVQLIGLVDYTSLKKSIWWRLLSRRPLNAFTDVTSTSSWDKLFQRLMTRCEKNWRYEGAFCIMSVQRVCR